MHYPLRDPNDCCTCSRSRKGNRKSARRTRLIAPKIQGTNSLIRITAVVDQSAPRRDGRCRKTNVSEIRETRCPATGRVDPCQTTAARSIAPTGSYLTSRGESRSGRPQSSRGGGLAPTTDGIQSQLKRIPSRE